MPVGLKICNRCRIQVPKANARPPTVIATVIESPPRATTLFQAPPPPTDEAARRGIFTPIRHQTPSRDPSSLNYLPRAHSPDPDLAIYFNRDKGGRVRGIAVKSKTARSPNKISKFEKYATYYLVKAEQKKEGRDDKGMYMGNPRGGPRSFLSPQPQRRKLKVTKRHGLRHGRAVHQAILAASVGAGNAHLVSTDGEVHNKFDEMHDSTMKVVGKIEKTRLTLASPSSFIEALHFRDLLRLHEIALVAVQIHGACESKYNEIKLIQSRQ